MNTPLEGLSSDAMLSAPWEAVVKEGKPLNIVIVCDGLESLDRAIAKYG